jgi:hypothetical protein
VTYRAVVGDNAGHQRLSDTQRAVVPAPKLSIELPAEGAGVFGTIEVEVTADPERASHVVRIQRKLPTDADWVTLNTDDSSPVYTYYDNLSTVPMGTQIQYRAVLDEPDGTQVISPIRTVTRTAPTPLVNSVTVAGSLQSEIGCATDLRPAPPVTSRSTRTTGCGKRLSSSRGATTRTRWPSTTHGMSTTAQAARRVVPIFRSASRRTAAALRSSGIRSPTS